MSRVVIIRDYAYPETDKRFHGVYSASGAGLSDDEEVPEIDLEHDDEESEYEDLEDEKLWEWIWTYQSSKQISENTGNS